VGREGCVRAPGPPAAIVLLLRRREGCASQRMCVSALYRSVSGGCARSGRAAASVDSTRRGLSPGRAGLHCAACARAASCACGCGAQGFTGTPWRRCLVSERPTSSESRRLAGRGWHLLNRGGAAPAPPPSRTSSPAQCKGRKVGSRRLVEQPGQRGRELSTSCPAWDESAAALGAGVRGLRSRWGGARVRKLLGKYRGASRTPCCSTP
jgi:hypothetical protein